MITNCYDYLKETVMSRLINLLIDVFLQIKITICYNYLNRNSYEQTDQSAHNLFTSNNENTAL